MDLQHAFELADEGRGGGYESLSSLALVFLADYVRKIQGTEEYWRLLASEKEMLQGCKVGTVQFLRSGGNAGLAWYVRPDPCAPMPNDGDIVYVVTPNVESNRRDGIAGTSELTAGLAGNGRKGR